MNHIPKDVLTELRDTLQREQKDLEKELGEHGKKIGGNWQGVASGFEGNEADETDGADKMEELATNISLVETLEARLKDVTDALQKMDNGTYGLSEGTGENIDIARLKANPAARTAL
ncbi:hypothetical protein HY969_02100 [Candidatus Kaiserbacteria bacterium]|nr:hypothetical protein [Candidatus Kaiserbacteria bacterium]